MILKTKRLYMREMTHEDFHALCKILQDEQVMYAYNGAFSDTEVHNWLEKQISRYKEFGIGLWAVILQGSEEMIGQCGLTMQPWEGTQLLEVGYLFQRAYWHNGYATEAAKACIDYAFNVLNAPEVCSIIRDTNLPSQNVATRNGMTNTGKVCVKHYRGVDMPHYLFIKTKEK